MALLLKEASNKFGSKIDAEIGNPLPWSDLENIGDRQELTTYLYNQVRSLASPQGITR
jgi:hypothetical protein